ncbi:MAG: polyisoprenoid-binding protein [Bacteriovoracaceae bacterium]|nr:polyisoprenoid-binding protein [Bacteriovoracaceae bacterium]
MKIFKSLLTLTAFSVITAQAATKWDLDPSHSSLNFAIDHLVISETTGKFDKFEIKTEASDTNFSDAKFSVKIDTNSINTSDAKRDGHLKSEDFFNTAKFPSITFEGKKFDKQKNGKYKITGLLTMHGITKEVTLDASFSGEVKDPWGATRVGIKLNGVINRYDWDLKYNSALESGGLTIGKEVRINGNIELIKKG